MIETNGKYYLGKQWDAATGKLGDEPLLYDSEDLTTHAVVVGMTGSGKTGLCVGLLEEAALNGVPALMVDPKGDLTNLLLHFPHLAPTDFQPWINAVEAKKSGKTEAQVAAETADMWKNGLAEWDITPERLQTLADSVRFTIYTPGSTAGVPLSVLASLSAPDLPWAGNEEILSEQISGTVTALLSLTGLKDIDPVQSREHILLSNIIANAWREGKPLDLGELIMQIQSPPFAKLGVFDVNTFFPEKDRAALAMRLNSMLASPSFQTWLSGEPLDAESLLYTADGRPRHSVFYIAHLSEEERMFFVTLLYSTIESWMRAQSGTSSLRALIYFDEIFGYVPPIGNPPSKTVILRMLKQARAFGVGLVLATQNPVDVDYKGLSNAGTWFIGKLATEQDKARLIDGLMSAAAGGVDVKEYDRLISGIGKRVFLMRNVHEKQPILFQTRWAMNYLAGPLTRAQIPALNALKGAGPAAAGPAGAAAAAAMATPAPSAPPKPAAPGTPEAVGTVTRPPVPSGVG
ncbi:ATP-binding protein, partial [Promineifilum sp.]|uniref:ATP-binding protein n=1 Tax=Promineifilum sp. TaxID=2664178 RepID=UPI0035B30D70